MADFRISSGRLLHVDAVIYRNSLPPCCVLLIVGIVRMLEFEFISGGIEVFKCSRSVNYVGVFFYKEKYTIVFYFVNQLITFLEKTLAMK